MKKNMNKKGFTLAELLIVIAILALLITMLLPSFVDLFSQSKTSILITETQSIMKQAQQQWLLSSGKNKVFSSSNSNALSLDNETDEFKYCVELDGNGYFKTVIVTNGEYAAYWIAKSSASGIKMADLSSDDTFNINDSNTTNKSYFVYINALASSTTGTTSCTTSITVPSGGTKYTGTAR